MDSEILSLKDIIDILKSKIILIAAIVILGTTVGIYYSKNYISPSYMTSTKLFIGKGLDSNEETIYESGDITFYQSLANTYAGVLSSRDLIEKAMKDCKCEVTDNYVISNLKVETEEKSQFLNLSILTPNEEDGVIILEAVTKEFINASKELVSNGNIKVITKPRIPECAYNYNPKRTVLIFFLGSVFIGICLAILLEFIDNTIKKKEDIDKILNVPILGVVPIYNDESDNVGKKKRERKRRRKRVLSNDYYGA